MTKSNVPELEGGEMMPTSSFPAPTTVVTGEANHAGGLKLLVLGQGLPSTYSLQPGKTMIGRSQDAAIRVDDESISRRHAVIHVGERLLIQDMGSLNGTRVRDRTLNNGETVEIQPGEAFEIGKVMAIVQRRAESGRPRKRIWPHGYFESRLEEECARRERTGGTFTLVRFHLDGTLPPGILESALDASLRVSDVAGNYGPGEVEVLFLDAAWDDVEMICDRFVTLMRAPRVKVNTGIAVYPSDGREASALMACANAKVRGAHVVDENVQLVQQGAMDRLRRLIDRVAKSDISIILHGETGVGKEVLAREIHKRSDRVGKPLVGLNCAALTETLLESELFGHERGAFSGAVSTKPGLFEVAEKGTVFLDEIGEMSLTIQAKLLRVLEERQVLRVGGLSPRAIDVRFLAASHRDLEAEVGTGRFRQDLYFRLNGITLTIPALRERTGEIEGLVTSFIADAARRSKRTEGVPMMSPESMSLLMGYAWPGNIRELRNVVERAVLLCTDNVITPEHLPAEKMATMTARAMRAPPPDLRQTAPLGTPIPHPARAFNTIATTRASQRVPGPEHGFVEDDDLPPPSRPTPRRPSLPEETHAPAPAPQAQLKGAVQDFERERILEALQKSGGNQTTAAKILGISRRTLLNRLDSYNLPRPRKGS